MKLYNTLTKQQTNLQPLDGKTVRIYSCGPTVYDNAHIGNLSAYVFADTLRRAVQRQHPVKHVMNYTDVDDKTIRRSQSEYTDQDRRERLHKLTSKYIGIFLEDMQLIGNDVDALNFVRATDEATLQAMRELISDLHAGGFAYIADDGVYFSIEAYRKAGKIYGQLLEITAGNTSDARIQNDEYDKESIHDFALWKKQKTGEPAWEFTIDGQDVTGRPGWHIECSAMSQQNLGQPFDVHTGGVDLIFPHHENEIAQSTALQPDPLMATVFAHNDHILVNGKKMSKSAQNFYTLQDIIAKGYDPLAFRLLVLQAHYRSQVNFTWESLDAAQNRLQGYRQWADLQLQGLESAELAHNYNETLPLLRSELDDDLGTPAVLAYLSGMTKQVEAASIDSTAIAEATLELDNLLGLSLHDRQDISNQQKQLLADRETARTNKDWAKSDELRDQLEEQGLGLRDTSQGAVWYRLNS